jgi:ABC-type transport system involved in multi-copper enzyme maturation permease subunit
MMLLPIVERELRVAARQWRTYWGRSLAGGVALGLVLHLIWAVGLLQAPGGGALILKIVSYMALAFCIFAGMSRTSDCISSEKREDTLGLLFLTHLKARDIVLGKLAAASIHAVLFLISIVPVLSVPVIFGGVSGSEMVRVPLSLGNALLMSLAIGLLASTLFRLQRQAALAASTTLVMVSAILPGAAAILNRDGEYQALKMVVWFLSPLFVNEMALSSGIGLSARWFWTSLAVQASISCAAVAASCFILPRVWQVKAGQRATIKDRLVRWAHGAPEARTARRRRLLARSPIFWLGARDRFGPLWPALFLIAGVIGAFALIAWYEVPPEPATVIFFIVLGVADFHFRVRVATQAAMLFGRERQMGTWEMILSTPLSVPEILRGNWMSIRHHLLRSYLAYVALFAASVWAAIVILEAPPERAWIGVFFLAMSAGEFVVLGWAGMWQGMRAANPLHAPAQALLRVTILPWASWLILGPLFNEVDVLRDWMEENNPHAFFLVTGAVWILGTLTALRTARHNLLTHFRDPSQAPSLRRWLQRRFSQSDQPLMKTNGHECRLLEPNHPIASK